MADITQATLQSSGTAPVRLVQTDALLYLLKEVAEHCDIGFFSASSEPFSCVPVLLVDEEVVLATAITVGATIDRAEQLQDWVIPSHLNQLPKQTSVRLFHRQDSWHSSHRYNRTLH